MIQFGTSIIYVEPSYSESLHGLIRRNLSVITQRAARQGCQFVYLPQQIEEGTMQKEIAYLFPNLTSAEVDAMVCQPDFVQLCYEQIAGGDIASPQLVLRGEGDEAIAVPEGCSIEEFLDVMARLPRLCWTDEACMIHSFSHNEVINHSCLSMRLTEESCDEPPLPMSCNTPDVEYADSDKSISNKSLCSRRATQKSEKHAELVDLELDEDAMTEVQAHISRLLELGLTEDKLRQILRLARPEVSRLLITPDLRIVLTDYQEREVRIPDLSKALFLLYLNHPEGIPFKCLVDYRQELINYYDRISHRVDLDKLNRSINALVDSAFSNSVNEKCSRIKRGFESVISPDLACPYIISKGHDGVQRIALDRKMVIDQAHILSLREVGRKGTEVNK